MQAKIGPCDDCGNITAVSNCNTVTNEYWLCGKCQYAKLGDIDAGQRWDAPDGSIRATMLNEQVWLMGGGFVGVKADQLPELLIVLQVAQARHNAAKGVLSNG
jgi:hypothetical protein